MELVIRRLSARDEAAFNVAREEFARVNPAFGFAAEIDEGMAYTDYLRRLAEFEAGRGIPENYVAATTLFGFFGDVCVGRVSIRHSLTAALMHVGGHVGYGTVPSYRGRGFATQMLKHALTVCRDLKIHRVLLTCDDSNIASYRTIEKCGGVLENRVESGSTQTLKRRYWITL